MIAFHRWTGGRTTAQSGLLSVACGGLAALGQPPFSQAFIALAGVFLMAALYLQAPSARRAALTGWLAGLGYFAGSVYWIVEPFLVDAPRHGWMAPFALIFMAGGLALFWGAGFWVAFKVGGARRWARLLGLVAGLGVMELARSYVLTGFPWGLLGYIWAESPVAQLAAYLGPHGLGALTLTIAVLPLISDGTQWWRGASVSAVVLMAAYGFGVIRGSSVVPPAVHAVNLRLVQPNASQKLKWQPDMLPVFYDRLLTLSAQAGAVTPDLIIWPETAVPFWLGDNPDQQQVIGQLASGTGRVILGLRRYEGQRIYNSLAVLDRQGKAQAVYDKMRLVPFGEYIPLGEVLSRFGISGLAASGGGGFSAGLSKDLLDLGAFGQVLPLVCYESIYPDLAIRNPRPDWILQITNDAWFGNFAGPFQHLAQARFRAIEQGLPFVRVANTGVTAVIDAHGRILASLDLGTSGVINAPLPGALSLTVYGKTGDAPLAGLLFLILGALGVARFRK